MLHRLADRDDREPVCLATRSAVRCRVPDSSVGIVGSGTSWTAARRIRVPSLVEDDRAVHLGQLAQPGGGELDVEREAAGAQRLDDLVVAEHDQRAGAAAQDALQAVAQRGAGGDRGQGGAQRVVAALGRCHSACSPVVVGQAGVYRRGAPSRAAHDRVTTMRHDAPAISRRRLANGITSAPGKATPQRVRRGRATSMATMPGGHLARVGRHERVGEAEPGGLGQPARQRR